MDVSLYKEQFGIQQKMLFGIQARTKRLGMDFVEDQLVIEIKYAKDWSPFPKIKGDFDYVVLEGNPLTHIASVRCRWGHGVHFDRHAHPGREEKLECISGAFSIMFDDSSDDIQIYPGESIVIPAGAWHAGYAHRDSVVIVSWRPPLETAAAIKEN